MFTWQTEATEEAPSPASQTPKNKTATDTFDYHENRPTRRETLGDDPPPETRGAERGCPYKTLGSQDGLRILFISYTTTDEKTDNDNDAYHYPFHATLVPPFPLPLKTWHVNGAAQQ